MGVAGPRWPPRVSLIYPFQDCLCSHKARLRSFFRQELSWNAEKVDELLLPIIHKMNKRGQVKLFSCWCFEIMNCLLMHMPKILQEAAASRQGTLNDFFGVTPGAGPAEPRKRQAYASKRLQALVSEHRKAQKQKANAAGPSRSQSVTDGANEDENGASSSKPPAKKRKKGPAAAEIGGETKVRKTTKRRANTRVGKGRSTKASKSSRKKPSEGMEEDA